MGVQGCNGRTSDSGAAAHLVGPSGALKSMSSLSSSWEAEHGCSRDAMVGPATPELRRTKSALLGR